MAGFGTFMSGMADTLDEGIALQESLASSGKRRANQELATILGEMESYDPYGEGGTFSPKAQGVPEATQSARNNPRQGFSGDDYAEMEKRYYQAASKLGSIEEYKAAREALGTARMNKINSTLDAALMAYDQGDAEGAAEAMRGASAFITPGVTPEISVDPDTGAFLVANYDPDGEPQGGYALTRDQIEDFRARNTDYNAWADRRQKSAEWNAEQDLARAKFASEHNARLVATQATKDRGTREAEQHAVDVANAKLEQRKLASEAHVAESTEESEIASTLATNEATVATKTEETRKAEAAPVDEAMLLLEELTTFNATEAQEYREGTRPGSDEWAEVQAGIFAGESGGNYSTLYGHNEGQGGAFGGTDLTNMTLDEVLAFNSPSGPYGQWAKANGIAAAPVGAYQFIHSTLKGLKTELGLSGTERFSQALQDQLGKHLWQTGGTGQWAGYKGKQAPGSGTTPAAAAANAATAEGAIPEDPLAILGEDKEKKPTEDEMEVDPWWYTEPDENGARYLKAGMKAASQDMIADILASNPNATPMAAATMALQSFGHGEQQQAVIEEDKATGEPIISNGIDRFRISKDTAGYILGFREDNAQALLDLQRDSATQPSAPGGEAGGAPPFPPAEPGPMAGPPAIPEGVPAGPGGAAPAQTPGAGAFPGGVNADPQIAAAAAMAGQGIPEPQAGPGPAPGPGPQTRPSIQAPVDETAVQAPGMAPVDPSRVEAAMVINRIPELAQAVRAWRSEGAPPQGPALQALIQIVQQLPPDLQQQAAREIRQLQGVTGRPEFR